MVRLDDGAEVTGVEQDPADAAAGVAGGAEEQVRTGYAYVVHTSTTVTLASNPVPLTFR